MRERMPHELEARRMVFRSAIRGVEELHSASVTAGRELASALAKGQKVLDEVKELTERLASLKTSMREQLAGVRRYQDEALAEIAMHESEDPQEVLF